MREHETENNLADMINKAPVGQELSVSFGGMPMYVDIEMSFIGGWVIKQSIAPGMKLKFIKGEEQYLEGIKITLNEFNGLK